MNPGAAIEARVDAALRRAEEALSGAQPTSRSAPTLHVAVGDPQAPARRLFEILEHRGLLAEDGWVRPEVHLVSVGDHFDYGAFEERVEAGENGMLSLSWLAAHSSEQVTLIAGNHDLARVGELWNMSDARFAEAAGRAAELYRAKPRDPERESAFLRDFPEFPNVEIAARDLATFSEAQRALVLRLLVNRRFRLAHAVGNVLVCHAGVTRQDLAVARATDTDAADAGRVESVLNGALDEAVDSWDQSAPFSIAGLHSPGSARAGEGGGVLYHRPTQPDGDMTLFSGLHRRRFDPRGLPRGITQVIGHVRDAKCRSLLGSWVRDAAPRVEGSLRYLVTDGRGVRYAATRRDARLSENSGAELGRLVFVDGGMNQVPADAYALCNLAGATPFGGFLGGVAERGDET